MKQGITIAGSTLVDHNKIIDDYPNKGMLTNIQKVYYQVGGCVPNTSLSLRRISKDIPINAVGLIGNDNDGKFLKKTLDDMCINTDQLEVSKEASTGFTDVMTIKKTGERTFFSNAGANNLFSLEHVLQKDISTKMFHIGYIFLLKQLDKKEKKYGTELAKLLNAVQNQGVKTSIDLISSKREDYREHVLPALKYTNYLIVNEIEAGLITNRSPHESKNKVNHAKMQLILNELLELGVQDKVIIHSPEGGWALDRQKNYQFVPSLNIKQSDIKSTVGAGDAFCAGILYSIYNNYNLEDSLKIANTTAAMSLNGYDSNSSIQSIHEILKKIKEHY